MEKVVDFLCWAALIFFALLIFAGILFVVGIIVYFYSEWKQTGRTEVYSEQQRMEDIIQMEALKADAARRAARKREKEKRRRERRWRKRNS